MTGLSPARSSQAAESDIAKAGQGVQAEFAEVNTSYSQARAMQWSKLKSRVKSLIAPELRDRIDFHLTSYRASHDGADKVWITIDGKRVFSCKHYEAEWASFTAYRSGLRGEEVKSVMREVQIHSPGDFGNAMRLYLTMPVAVALSSDDPLIKAFAIVDRRIGKRSLAKLDLSDCDHALVKAFYKLRCDSPRI